jgi:predicted nuclease with TOPRIM domain
MADITAAVETLIRQKLHFESETMKLRERVIELEAESKRLRSRLSRAEGLLKRLQAWAAYMGGFDSSIWGEVAKVVRKTNSK